MRDWKKVVIAPEMTIRETIKTIDASAMQIALVVDCDKRLLGTITDGDIRRGILKGITLEDTAHQIMNPTPVVAKANESPDIILSLMRSRSIHQIPVVDNEGSLVGVEILDEMLQMPQRHNPVILMAGGLGSRLRPLTDNCPKPLLKVGTKPILETIIENFTEHGFRDFYISVNYMAEMIEQYFGDGAQWGVHISYIREKERMGTAGALSLIPGEVKEPMVVMNGDLLTKVNFNHLLAFHSEHQAKATMCVRDYQVQIPYGVVRVEKHRMTEIEEKPVQKFFVNAGIYVLEPDVLKMIPSQTFFDMPHLFEKLIQHNMETAVFPVREYWLDIGRVDDFERANLEYIKVFE